MAETVILEIRPASETRNYVASKQLMIPVRPQAAAEMIARRIYRIRAKKVMLDSDLAELYRVRTKAFNQAIKRNRSRFPGDFMFRLTTAEAQLLRSQIVTSNNGRGGRRYRPFVFTQEGVAMLSSILNSNRAVQVNIAIMRAFMKMREMASTYSNLARKLAELESRCDSHDENIKLVFHTLKELTRPPAPRRRRMGFVNDNRPA
ncbi:MAG TPA: ORF6N domain-containing protein [Bryobacteraceae bacterium]|nr:ORF6N domain-containing protein [Bryobacteraceae bacterium]